MMHRKTFLGLVLVLSLSLSACQITDLTTLVNTERTNTAKPTWTQDGDTYTTTSTYDTAEGQESNVFTITIVDGTIKSLDVGITTQTKASIKYQTDFAKNISSLVVGKKLSELQGIDRVSGASLTTAAFNDAISRLQKELES